MISFAYESKPPRSDHACEHRLRRSRSGVEIRRGQIVADLFRSARDNASAAIAADAFDEDLPFVDARRSGPRDAAAGRTTMVLIIGQAGIGKTRLADEVVGLAARRGGAVLSARCYAAERSLFLQPFVEAIGQHAAPAPAALVRSVGTPALADLGRV